MVFQPHGRLGRPPRGIPSNNEYACWLSGWLSHSQFRGLMLTSTLRWLATPSQKCNGKVLTRSPMVVVRLALFTRLIAAFRLSRRAIAESSEASRACDRALAAADLLPEVQPEHRHYEP
jgi:hypothetical protein